MIPFFLLPGIRKVEASNKLRFLVNVSPARSNGQRFTGWNLSGKTKRSMRGLDARELCHLSQHLECGVHNALPRGPASCC